MMKHAVKLTFSIAIILLLFWHIGFAKITDQMLKINFWALFVINVTSMATFLLGGANVIFLAKVINPEILWRDAMKGFLKTMSLSLFLPSRAGDFALPFFWKKYMRYGECLAVIVIDKIMTLTLVLVLGALGIQVVFGRTLGFFFAGFVLLSGALFVVLLAIPKTRLILNAYLPSKVKRFLEGSMIGLRALLSRGLWTMGGVLLLTIARLMLYGVGLWITFWGIEVPVSLFYSVVTVAMAQFVGLLPITIMGLGSIESVCILAFHQINIDSGAVVAALLIGRVTTLFWLSLFFIVLNTKEDAGRNA